MHTRAIEDAEAIQTDDWARTRGMRRMRAALQSGLLFPTLSSFCRLTVREREVLRALNGPAVFVSNHVSALDAVVMAEALPPRYRHRSVVVAAADSIFKRRWEARLAQVTVDAFPIPRGGGARPHLEYLKQLLSRKWSVIIFPEGRLTATGNIGTFRKGAAILAMDSGVPVVPAYMDGMFDVLPRFRRVPRPGKVTVTFGPPLLAGRDEDYDAFTARIEGVVRELAGPKGVAVEPPGGSRSEGPTYWY
ncbi:MAG TPA: lysophospholipid acyltransferase family protein [Candidatus Limnocylindrales bacterium]|nr:lysophospholipid acyltransferase family protein [Candidatus Limnocylindrales bacterium]